MSIPSKPVVYTREKTLEDKIQDKFGENAVKMSAIFMAESGMNSKAVGYNCMYLNEEGKPYSRRCDIPDRSKAWSVDCGIGQINHKGNKCPEESFDIDYNLELAKKKLDTEGLGAWVVYKTGVYKKYL